MKLISIFYFIGFIKAYFMTAHHLRERGDLLGYSVMLILRLNLSRFWL